MAVTAAERAEGWVEERVIHGELYLVDARGGMTLARIIRQTGS